MSDSFTSTDYNKELPYTENANGCWVYALKSRDRAGYSIIKHQGKNYYGHVFNFLKYNGPLLPGEEVRHSKNCDKACIRPIHLGKGSHAENMADIKLHAKQFCAAGHELNKVNSYKFNGSTICKRCKSVQLVELAKQRRATEEARR